MEKRQAGVPTQVGMETPEWTAADEHILDRASVLMAARGAARLTIAELAREARVSRPTIYRRWSSADHVVREVLLRRIVLILRELDPDATTRDQLVDQALRFADLFRDDPVFNTLLTSEPAVFSRYSFERIGSSQQVLLGFLASAIARGQVGGTVRPGDARDISVMLLLIVQSAVLSHQAVSSLIGEEEWRTELRRAMDGYLRP